jgi:hypothetical protein
LSEDGVRDSALEAAEGFEGSLAVGWLAPVVGPAIGVEADLADRGDVDHVVDPAVAGPGEPVPGLLTG